MKKKILAVSLVVILLATCLLPCAAFAAEVEHTKPETNLGLSVPDIHGDFPEDILLEISPGGLSTFYGWRIVRLEYLVDFIDAPFAHMESILLRVPCEVYVDTNTGEDVGIDTSSITEASFFEALDLDVFGVLHSFVDNFELQEILDDNGYPEFKRDDEGHLVYRAIYYETFYLCAKNSNGGSKNFYLNCNVSFTDYFNSSLEAGILDPRDVSVFQNNIMRLYGNVIPRDSFDNLYGYWGFIAIPEGSKVNEFFADIGAGTFMSPNVCSILFTHNISFEEDGSLGKEYGESPLGTFIRSLGNVFSLQMPRADCYLLYMDGGDSTVLIAQNGSSDLDNNMGAGGNGIVDGIQSIDWSKFSPSTVLALILALAFVVLIFVVVLKIGKKRKK